MPKMVECYNCGKQFVFESDDYTHLCFVEDLGERIDPGSEVPAGECLECGALVYLLEKETRK